MDPDEIKTLIKAFAASDLAEMELTRGEWTLRLVRSADGAALVRPAGGPAARPGTAPRAAAAPAPPAAVETDVRAPLSGLVYLSASPGVPDFVAVGRRVEAGDVVAVIEAMKVFNEIRAERAGTVQALLVASGDEVDAGQLLMRIG
jgi:acetyl-CoA carboxylase biotin carboxyl carrier protein